MAKDLDLAKKAGRAGSQNTGLVCHMKRLQEIDDDLEYFQLIKDYFKKENILVDILQTHPFSHKGRVGYFRNVLAAVPKKTLLFLDPDTGLEDSRPSKKHLLFEEVKKIAGMMDTQSVMMIYQHFPREKHEGFVRRRCSELHKVTGCCPISIMDNEIVFFFMVKNEKTREFLDEVLTRYADTYPVLESCSCG